MTWTKRDPVSNLVVLGDDEGQVRKVGGLLAAVTQDQQYPSRNNYELVQKDGNSIVVAGSASLSRQIFPKDVGKFLKATFLGWGKSPNGKFKQIEVNIWDGEPNDEMRRWPRYDEFTNSKGRATAEKPARSEFDDLPAALQDESDYVPF